MIPIDRNKTLEQLENDFWPSLKEYPSNMVAKCYTLRKKVVKDLSIEDLRLLISQNIGLKYLIPLATEALKANPFSEGDFYEGDLLKSVLSSDKEYWANNIESKKEIINIFNSNKQALVRLDTTDDIKEGLMDAFNNFQS